jgi:hypothetical protein
LKADFRYVRVPWYHRQESNLYLALRRRSFYPLNYGGWRPAIVWRVSEPPYGCTDGTSLPASLAKRREGRVNRAERGEEAFGNEALEGAK